MNNHPSVKEILFLIFCINVNLNKTSVLNNFQIVS